MAAFSVAYNQISYYYYYYYYQFTKKEGIHKRQSLYKVSAYKKQTNIHIHIPTVHYKLNSTQQNTKQ